MQAVYADFLSPPQELLATEGVAETFRSQTISVSNTQSSSRTYYMVAPSDDERERWVESITKNIRAYAVKIYVPAFIPMNPVLDP